jgi:NADH-quinone oxidoreductase subunit C
VAEEREDQPNEESGSEPQPPAETSANPPGEDLPGPEGQPASSTSSDSAESSNPDKPASPPSAGSDPDKPSHPAGDDTESDKPAPPAPASDPDKLASPAPAGNAPDKPASPGDAKPAVPKPPPKKPARKKPKGPVPGPWSSPLVDALREKFPGQVLDSYKFISQRQILIKKDRVTEIMGFLRRNDIEAFDFLSDETATHWPKEEEFELVYNLYSFETNDRLRVKARIKEWEQVESLVSVWPGTNWLEREIYDMFGIQFANHPNLKRILLPEDWVGFPLRKDYNIRLQDVEWVRKHLGIDSGQKFYVGEARHGED